jgi:hypothetical protein
MDVLDDHSAAIAERLSLLMRPLIDQELSVVFYDLTTITVHGEAKLEGDTRQHGMSKDGGIRRQVMLSLVQTAEGLPIAHAVHAGNTAEGPRRCCPPSARCSSAGRSSAWCWWLTADCSA